MREDDLTWWTRCCKADLKRKPLTAEELANGRVNFKLRRTENASKG